MQRFPRLAVTTLALAVGGAPSFAADDKIDLATWDQADLQQGWPAQRLLGSAAYDPDGNEVGQVENFYLDDDGVITKVIVEAGGFLDIGDTHLSVTWPDVTLGEEARSVTVPIEADKVDAFSLFGEDPRPAMAEYRVTEFIGDYVFLSQGEGYGLVQDLIFDRDGMAQAVIVNPDVTIGRPGYYVYPYYGPRAGNQPRSDVYNLPYSMREVEMLGPFDYEAIRG